MQRECFKSRTSSTSLSKVVLSSLMKPRVSLASAEMAETGTELHQQFEDYRVTHVPLPQYEPHGNFHHPLPLPPRPHPEPPPAVVMAAPAAGRRHFWHQLRVARHTTPEVPRCYSFQSPSVAHERDSAA